jgi:hypothetical protein
MSKSKNFYSYAEDTKAIAFIDIIGFGQLTKKSPENLNAESTFLFFENCIHPYRESMKPGVPHFKREVPLKDPEANGHKYGFWYNEVNEAAVNFIYMSDSAVLYSSSLTHLFRELSAIFGSAVVWAVPIRAVVTMGDIHHSEWIERPGSANCFYGSALTKAVEIEKSKSGKGMRVWLDDDVVELMRSIPDLNELIEPGTCFDSHAQLRWWRNALLAVGSKKESEQMKWHFDRWYTEKHTKNWFTGKNKIDTDKVIEYAIDDLNRLGK